MFAIFQYFEIFRNVLVLNSAAAARLNFLLNILASLVGVSKYSCACLNISVTSISCACLYTINWDSCACLYTINQLLLNIQPQLDQICYINSLYWFLCHFQSPSVHLHQTLFVVWCFGCLMLRCMCSMLHCMLTSHELVGQVPFG